MQKITIVVFLLALTTFVGCKQQTSKTNENISAFTGDLRIATVNTDSLSANFDMVNDVKKEIEATNSKLENDLQRQMASFKADYENYLKIGATMTLSEQKKKESQLEQRQQNLVALQQRYGEQAAQVQLQKMQEIQDYIFTFIAKYNSEHDKYNIILPKSMTSGVLYADPSMDITGEVIDAINADYAKNRKK
ncbi:MAG: OmpH family outer membrane protein [Bacteroidales bacterium]|jgi:outer membrane protein|nr:OmpH family outer membrane protein [Bacteroidales bacterium]